MQLPISLRIDHVAAHAPLRCYVRSGSAQRCQRIFRHTERNVEKAVRGGVAMRALNKVQLGTAEVTNACIGTMMMGSTNTEEEAFAQLDYFREKGGNFLDTAEIYPVPMHPELAGKSEVIVGNWMKERGCRDEMIIATKAAGPIPDGLSGKMSGKSLAKDMRYRYLDSENIPEDSDIPSLGHSADNYKVALEASLKKLGIDYVDLYQLHWPERPIPLFGKHQYNPEMCKDADRSFDETVTAIGDLLASGKVKQWGLSNETAYGVTMMCETAKRLGVALPVSIQNDYSITDRHFDIDLAEACAAYNVKLLSYGSLNGGYLSGKYLDGKRPEGARHSKSAEFQHRYCSPAVETALKKYKVLADSKGLSLTQLVIAWVASRWHLGSIITGQTNVTQLEEYLGAFDLTLDEETLEDVERIHKEARNPNWSD